MSSRRSRHALWVAVLLGLLVASFGADFASAAWSWKAKGRIPGVTGSADELSCPTLKLCVVAGTHHVYWTTTPVGAATKWKRAAVDPAGDALGSFAVSEVSCPTATFCVAGDNHSQVFTSTNPTGGVGAWVRSDLPSDTFVGVRALACPTTGMCAALDESGYALTTPTPQGFGSAWTRTKINTTASAALSDLDCRSRVCAAVESDQRVWVTNDPTAQPAAWFAVTLTSGLKRLNAVTCGSNTFCIAAGDGRKIWVSKSPSAAKSAWKAVTLPAGVSGIDHITCKSPTLCLALSGANVWVSATPAVGASWRKTLSTKGVILSDVSCPTPRRCIVVDVSGKVWAGARSASR